jgi:hypothetical protein
MEPVLSTRADEPGPGYTSHGRSAASWGAILAGALVAASVSLILAALGAGLGFASVSPWHGHGATFTTFAVTTAIWFIVMQWVSAGIGGFIAGRLRTRWIGTHTHEVFFRDTAHGLVTWALATIVVAMVFASSVSSLIGGGVHAASTIAAGAADTINTSGASLSANYNIDRLFRGAGDSVSGTSDYRGEATRILANAVTTGSVPPADRTYLATLIAHKTGVSQEDAQKRVDDAVASAMDAQANVKAAADATRKATAEAAIYTALSMLIGAFIASVSAVLGGHLRDEHP